MLLLEMVRVSVAHAGLELEVALAPDGEGVHGLLARDVLELGVHDLARRSGRSGPCSGPSVEMEDARLPADADELDDVGEVKLGE